MKTISLTRGFVTLVDDEDYDDLIQFKWKVSGRPSCLYASRTQYRGNTRTESAMHRAIMKSLPGQRVDHIDGDTLNNQRANLRFASNAENQMNLHRTRGSSKWKGVCWEPRHNAWKAYIWYDGKSHNLGRYKSENEAAQVYNTAAQHHFGDFACLNKL